MVIVKLQGGLGNQMFQYAAGRSLIVDNAKVLLDQTFLRLNTKDLDGFTPRKFELGIFKNIRARDAKTWEVNQALGKYRFNRIYNAITRSKFITYQQYGNELIEFSFAKSLRKYLVGYFQSEKYFSSIREELKKEFEFPLLDKVNENFRNEILASKNAVSIHVRRGDYLKSEITRKTHGLIPPNFYYKALQQLSQNYDLDKIFVFSDDILWAKANINVGDLKFTYVDVNHGKDSWKDMALMSLCKHHIIANSSFSWWGAWLSNQNGQVYAPQYWFNPQFVDFNIDDFIPKTWTVLSYD